MKIVEHQLPHEGHGVTRVRHEPASTARVVFGETRVELKGESSIVKRE